MRVYPERLAVAERFDRLRLIRSENVGPVTFRQLLHRYRTASEALDALPMLARRGGRRVIRIAESTDIQAELDKLAEFGGEMVFEGEDAYPRALSATDDAAPILSVIGRKDLLDRPCLGIVGGRNASIHGRALASDMATALGKAGFVITSGMARGIDTAAHTGAIDTGTVAVLAGGVDHVYPAENAPLYEQLATDGLIVSEMPLGMVPKAQHFPRRNRIISGLSQGIVVIEARRKSGSLITARYAADQGREVFAVPGFPQDPRAQGGNDLIKAGAALVQSADDILEELSSNRLGELSEPTRETTEPEMGEAELDSIRSQIVDSLNAVPLPVDVLLRSFEVPSGAVQLALLELELAGRIKRHPGGKLSASPANPQQ